MLLSTLHVYTRARFLRSLVSTTTSFGSTWLGLHPPRHGKAHHLGQQEHMEKRVSRVRQCRKSLTARVGTKSKPSPPSIRLRSRCSGYDTRTTYRWSKTIDFYTRLPNSSPRTSISGAGKPYWRTSDEKKDPRRKNTRHPTSHSRIKIVRGFSTNQ